MNYLALIFCTSVSALLCIEHNFSYLDFSSLVEPVLKQSPPEEALLHMKYQILLLGSLFLTPILVLFGFIYDAFLVTLTCCSGGHVVGSYIHRMAFKHLFDLLDTTLRQMGRWSVMQYRTKRR